MEDAKLEITAPSDVGGRCENDRSATRIAKKFYEVVCLPGLITYANFGDNLFLFGAESNLMLLT